MQFVAFYCPLYLSLRDRNVGLLLSDCIIDMNSDLPKHKAPLFVDENELLLPKPQGKTGVLELASGQEVTLACPGTKNQVGASACLAVLGGA